MKTQQEWNDLREDHELAFFKADVCLGSPQSFSLDEKKQICEEMEASTAAIDAALKADFESLPRGPGHASGHALRIGLHDAGMVEVHPLRRDARLGRRD